MSRFHKKRKGSRHVYAGETAAAGPSKTFHSNRIIRVVDTSFDGIVRLKNNVDLDDYRKDVRRGDRFFVVNVDGHNKEKGVVQLTVAPATINPRLGAAIYEMIAKEYAIEDAGMPPPDYSPEIT